MTTNSTLPRKYFFIVMAVQFSNPVFAQNKLELYAGLVNSKGYVAGAKLSASGLYQFNGDTSWNHIGWNHPHVNGISFDPNNPDIIFLACGNGVLRTLDGGKSWRITTDWHVTEAQDISVDPIKPQNVYVATAYGVWVSRDKGETWTESNVGLPKKYTQTIEVDRRQSLRVIAGTEGGLFVSTDGAKSWSIVSPKDVSVYDIQQSTSSPSIWLAGTEQKGVLISNNDGQNWFQAMGNIAHKSIYAVAIDPFDPGNMSAGGWDTGVFISEDGGKNWQQHKAGLPTLNIYELIFDVHRSGQIWAATVEEGIFKSNNFGRKWNYCGMFGALVFDMIFIGKKDSSTK